MTMIPRHLKPVLLRMAAQFPVVTLTGPRQSGKTTLARAVFPKHRYISLEAPDERAYALEDPRGFLQRFDGPVVLDEAQRAPDLFSYLQGIVDERRRPGEFILTGSQNFLLLHSISQSLAGRAAIMTLLPFSLAELHRRSPFPLQKLGETVPKIPPPTRGLMETMFTGFYPAIHDRGIDPVPWLSSYYTTYVERDVRAILDVGDLNAFGRLIRLAAGRVGQLLNLSSLAADAGVSHQTARRWLSVLEASFIIALLPPYHQNFGKRMIKSPKLYFLDPGLLCFLLGVQSPGQLYQHPFRGGIFESFVVSEVFKLFGNRGERPAVYFWRDSAGHEVDLVVEAAGRLTPVEIKSGETIGSDFFAGLEYWLGLAGGGPAALVYGGAEPQHRRGIAVYPWSSL